MFGPVRHKLVYEVVADEIISRIRSGELAVGEKLPPERVLAEDLGVSRTSLREALRSLVSMGYIRSAIGGGNYVNEVGIEHVLPSLSALMTQDKELAADIIEVRRFLEAHTASLAAKHSTKTQQARIYGTILDMQAEIENGGNGAKGDYSFHLEIAHACGNRGFSVIVELCNELVAESQQATLNIPGQPSKSVQDHLLIFEAIRSGDEKRARHEMDLHLDKAMRNLEKKAALVAQAVHPK